MDRIQLRRDTAARWVEINPVLLEGEVGYETDTKLRKIGDGVKRWNELGYLNAEGIVQETGNGENVVMSQKAVSGKLAELESYTTPLVRLSWIANGIWINNNSKHIIFPVLPNSLVEIETARFGYYTFLADYKTPIINEQPVFAEGYNDRVYIEVSAKVIAPTNAKFLYVNYNENSDYVIKSIKIDGVERYTTLDWVVTEIAAELEKVKPVVEDLKANTIQERDLSYGSGTSNIANPANIINNKIVDNFGAILDIQGWSIIKVDVHPGKELTFGGFYLGRNGYLAFYKDSELISVTQFYDPNGIDNPLALEVPAGANLLYIDIQTPLSPSNPYEKLQINYGDTLKPYEEYVVVIEGINGVPLKGANSETEGGATIVDLMIDLPVSDGNDIPSGFAYIDSQTKNIKVK